MPKENQKSERPVTVAAILKKRKAGEKIVVVTAYDYPFAQLVDRAGADIVFVGDSVGRAELGFENELPVTLEIMLHHVRAARRGTTHALLLADMPFLTYQVNADEAVRNAGRLVQEGGANAVKLEGGVRIASTIRRIVDAGIPVCGHIGFTPQSVNQSGAHKYGRDAEEVQQVLDDARAVEEAGAFAIVLELIPEDVAARVTDALSIPTIGIGAGPHCAGQVLVITDLLALHADDHPPYKHVREYAQIGRDVLRALAEFGDDVRQGRFPA
jgi:3-methyl-2-oxobutanoate hydroxymethyltransferase